MSTDRRAVPPGEFYLSDSVADLLGRLAARQLLELRIRGARLADVLSRGEIIVDALQSVHLVGQDQRLRSSRTSAMCLATRS